MAQRKTASGTVGGGLRTLAITSGKGGVGKTNVVVNLAICLAAQGQKVLVIDADLGLANVDVILGLNPQYSIKDVLSGEKSLDEVVVKGPGGISILPATSGVAELSNLSSEEKMIFLQALDDFDTDADIVLVDTAAGISDTVMYFNIAAQDRLVIATGEPTSLTDAYALIKVLHTQHNEQEFKLLVNNVADAREAKEVYRKLSMAADHFLGGLHIDYMGFIPTDPALRKAVMEQRPVVLGHPGCLASKAFAKLAQVILGSPARQSAGNIKFFWRRLVNMA